jgi:hypothetical protein
MSLFGSVNRPAGQSVFGGGFGGSTSTPFGQSTANTTVRALLLACYLKMIGRLVTDTNNCIANNSTAATATTSSCPITRTITGRQPDGKLAMAARQSDTS